MPFPAGAEGAGMEWRNWSREQDREKAEAEKQWKDNIDATLTAKVDWKKKAQEELTTSTISRTMQETLSALNAQLASIQQNTGIQTSPVNVAAAIQETIAQIRLAEPKSERLKEINQEIATFNTRISLSELTQQRAGSLDAVENAFTALMTDHSREMTVLANAKAHDRYRQIILDFMEQYEDQNKKIDLQTASAAGSAGYVRAGGVYVKPGENTAGVVHAYTFFDTKGAINQALANVGFSEMSGNALVDFLKNKSDAEVGAYFKMQQTAVTLAFEKVAGKGSSAERENSRDERVIGSFGKWAGKQQDSGTANQLVTHGGPGADPLKAQQAGDYLSYVSFSGFGELGETALRPSSVGPGFYVELELSNRIFGQEMARQQMKGMGSLDPASTFVNQYNPVAMMAQATQNVRLATLTQGKSEGYMWEAQALNMAKAPIVATGSALVMYGASPAGDPVTKGLAMIAGGALSFLGNSIQVNPTTGERLLKATDQSVIATSVAFFGSVFGGAQLFNATGSMFYAGSSALAASSVRYDSEGRAQGASLESRHGDMHGERAILNATTAMITSAAGQYAQNHGAVGTNSEIGNAIWGDLIGTSVNVASEYGTQQTWGKDKSGYDALGRPDAGRLAALAGTIALAANKDRYQNEAIAAAQKAAKEGNKQKAVEILAAAGFAEDRRRRMADQMDAQARLAKPLEGGADNFAKLLRTAAGADGRLGAQNAASMAAGEQLNTAIADDVKKLARDGEISLADALVLADKYKVSPAALFSAANAQNAGALFSQNWSGAYQAQLAKDAEAARPAVQARDVAMSEGGSWGSDFMNAAARKLLGPLGILLPPGALNAADVRDSAKPPMTAEEANARAVRLIKEATARKAGAERALNLESNAADAAAGILKTPGGLVSTSVGLGILALNPLALAAKASGAEAAVVNYLNELTRNEALDEARTDMVIEALTEQMARDPAGVPEFVKGYAHLSKGVEAGGMFLGETLATLGAGRLLGAVARYAAEYETMASRAWGQAGADLASLRWGQGSGGFSSQAAVVESGMSRAAIGEIGQNIYSTAASTRIAQEVQGATSQAARMLDAGLTGGSKWGSIYQKVQGSGRWYEALARGNAIDDIARDLLANNRYLTGAGAVFNKGSLINARNSAGNLLRPDIQIPLGKGTYGIIDITTAAQQSKIYKYASSQVKYLINVIY